MKSETACGWNVINIRINTDGSSIGDIVVPLLNGNYHMPSEWDKNGIPKDIDKYPSRYYTRLMK